MNLGSYYLVGIPLAVVLAFVLHVGGKVISLTPILVFYTATFWKRKRVIFVTSICSFLRVGSLAWDNLRTRCTSVISPDNHHKNKLGARSKSLSL